MEISTYVCSACTTASIASLGLEIDAPHAMYTFCKKCLLGYEDRYGGGSTYNKLDSFFVYTAGPEEPGHGHSKDWVHYGTEFTQFLIDNKLGPVVTPGRTLNVKYHPDTYCQTWVWMPDRDAIIKWWEKNHMNFEEMEAELKRKAEAAKPAPAPAVYAAPYPGGGRLYDPLKKPREGDLHPGPDNWDWAGAIAKNGRKCECGSLYVYGEPIYYKGGGIANSYWCEDCAIKHGIKKPWEAALPPLNPGQKYVVKEGNVAIVDVAPPAPAVKWGGGEIKFAQMPIQAQAGGIGGYAFGDIYYVDKAKVPLKVRPKAQGQPKRPEIGDPHTVRANEGWDWIAGLEGSYCSGCHHRFVKGDLFVSAPELGGYHHCEACALASGRVQPWLVKKDMVGQRPKYPTVEYMCPRCGDDWGRHDGWRCKDGGEWPE